jgi:hypothetical integral membrane protein (TIGR02206 family)
MNAHDWIGLGLGWYVFLATFLFLWLVAPGADRPSSKAFEKGLAYFIALNYGFYHVSAALRGEWTLQDSLPLHMCNLTQLLLIWHLLSGQQWAFRIAAVWGPLGGVQALLTPAIEPNYWVPLVFQFFIAHSLVILVPIYLLVRAERRLPQRFFWPILGYTHGVALVLYLVNRWVGSNYMYVNQPPPVDHPLLHGGWPLYLVWIDVALVVLVAGYLWAVRKYTQAAGTEASSLLPSENETFKS